MAEFKKLINPPIKASEINSESATNGQVLTANGTGGATWQDASGGTEVVANPTLAGNESDLTGLEVAGTKYKVPTGGSGGGTQLYKHNVVLDSTDNFIFVLSTEPEIISLGEVMTNEPVLAIYYIVNKKTFSCFFEYLDDRMNSNCSFYYYEGNQLVKKDYIPYMVSVTDTVTPL